MLIFSAPWVVPVAVPIIRDGSIVVDDDRIIAVGKRDDMVQKYPNVKETIFSCVLMPGLVNAHMHLELSHLQNSPEPRSDQKFTDWIDALIKKRGVEQISREEIVAAFKAELRGQRQSGVVLIGDIGNHCYAEIEGEGDNLQPKVIRMIEYLGPNNEACRFAFYNLTELDDETAVTGHAPYSTAPELLSAIKSRCDKLGHIFSIHACESQDEREFIQSGQGCFRDFLQKRNSWDGLFSFSENGFPSTIEYFDHLGLLNDKTLLVHCVHVTEKDLLLIKKRGSHICLCPGSNQFLHVGRAPVEQMVSLGLLPALGTDSFASNHAIDIWREMRLLVQNHSNPGYTEVLAMATLGGAKALQCDATWGSLAVGKRADFIHVSSIALKHCNESVQLIKELVSGGQPPEIQWVSSVQD